MFFPTAEECCSKIFGRNGMSCEVYERTCSKDVLGDAGLGGGGGGGGGPAPQGAGDCSVPGWHADMVTKSGCTNDPTDYPQEWLEDPEMRGRMFHGSSRKCCDFFFGGTGQGCEVRDVGCAIDSSLLHAGAEQQEQEESAAAASDPTNGPTRPVSLLLAAAWRLPRY